MNDDPIISPEDFKISEARIKYGNSSWEGLPKATKLVIIESPLNASTRYQIEQNKLYARRCLRDSLLRGEAPFASHLLYDQLGVLNDLVSEDRKLGMNAGFEWGKHADLIAVYIDLGISNGMKEGILIYEKLGIKIVHRSIK